MDSSGTTTDSLLNENLSLTVNPAVSYIRKANVDSTLKKEIEEHKASPSRPDAKASSSSLIPRLSLTQSYSSTNSSPIITNFFSTTKGISYPLTTKQLEELENQHLHSADSSEILPLTRGAATIRGESNLTSSPGNNGSPDFWNRRLPSVVCSLFSRFSILAAAEFPRQIETTHSDDNPKLVAGSTETTEKFQDCLPQQIIVSNSGAAIEPGAENKHTLSLTEIPNNLIMKEDTAVEIVLKSLVSGGVAGMCAKTAVAPLDRMKILLQAHSSHYSHLGVFSGLKGIVEKERFIALYKGNGAQMVRIFPYAAAQFTSFEKYKKLFGESHIGRFAAGSAAGVTAVVLTYPLDTIRARLAFQISGEHLYNGIYQCATHIFREEGGVRALYRGFTPTICGMIPYAGLSFYCFESFKYLCMKYSPGITCKQHLTNTGGLVLLLPFKLLCGGVAGAVAQTVSYPLDVTRRRMQLAMMNENTKRFGMGMVSTLKIIYQENGVIRGLYRGMSINYLRAIPMVAVSFSTYEMMKQVLNLDTGLPMKTG